MSDPQMQPPSWKPLTDIRQFDKIIKGSKTKPVLIFKYHPASSESASAKRNLDMNWSIPAEMMDTYIVDVNAYREVSDVVTEVAGVDNNMPQVLLFADGVTMYDESHELISYKKIKIALKIINRTFRWMETRV